MKNGNGEIDRAMNVDGGVRCKVCALSINRKQQFIDGMMLQRRDKQCEDRRVRLIWLNKWLNHCRGAKKRDQSSSSYVIGLIASHVILQQDDGQTLATAIIYSIGVSGLQAESRSRQRNGSWWEKTNHLCKDCYLNKRRT